MLWNEITAFPLCNVAGTCRQADSFASSVDRLRLLDNVKFPPFQRPLDTRLSCRRRTARRCAWCSWCCQQMWTLSMIKLHATVVGRTKLTTLTTIDVPWMNETSRKGLSSELGIKFQRPNSLIKLLIRTFRYDVSFKRS